MFSIIPFEQQHKSAVLELLFGSYLPEDPAAVAIGITREDATPRYERIVEKSLADGFSLVAIDGNGIVIGCRLSFVWNRGDPALVPSKSNYRPIEEITIRLQDDFNKAFPNADRALKFVILTVHPSFRRLGIARQLLQKAIDAAKMNKIPVIYVNNYTYKTQNLCESLGFKTLATYDYAETSFEKVPEGEKCIKLMALEF